MIAIFESKRPRVLIETAVFALFLFSKSNTNVSAKKNCGPVSSHADIDTRILFPCSSPGTGISIIRGGSLDEGSSNNIEDGNDADEEEINTSFSSITEIATALRLEGKKYHDEGDFVKAAEVFQKAADTFLDGDKDNTESSSMRVSDDYATCRLHQALCNLKSENYEMCIEACTDVLQDNGDAANSGSIHSPAINARAYHRRAKAKMALGDNSGALQDARTASFLGDGKAVNLYGKLMRETSSTDLSSLMNPLLYPESSPSTTSVPPISPHSALLESLINKSGSGNENGSSPGTLPDFSPASLLLGNGGSNNLLGALGAGGGGMAKSVLKNLVQRLDDESTQRAICNFLQKTSKPQLTYFASMAGIENLEDSQLDRLVHFCHGITPKGISRTVLGTKVIIYFVKVIRRTMKVINKYKSLIVLALIFQWTKSAILRPLPIDKKAVKRAAKLASKEALKEAMKASRAGFF
mmetsp:Transcript_4567/g.11766  ORF Transcript_4567/g.11766 Transcript_4567/m.11766 type:complete len:468 (+) Transcript_4567:177-1580(+)